MLNLILGGIVRCSNDLTALISDTSPEAPSVWPTFGLTEVIWIPASPKTLATAPVSIGSPTDVPVPWHSKYAVLEKSYKHTQSSS